MEQEKLQLVTIFSLMIFMHFFLPTTELMPSPNKSLSSTDPMSHHGSFFDTSTTSDHHKAHVLYVEELPEHVHCEHSDEHDIEELDEVFSVEEVIGLITYEVSCLHPTDHDHKQMMDMWTKNGNQFTRTVMRQWDSSLRLFSLGIYQKLIQRL